MSLAQEQSEARRAADELFESSEDREEARRMTDEVMMGTESAGTGLSAARRAAEELFAKKEPAAGEASEEKSE